MAHNCWFVGFRLQQVPSVTFRWSAGHGGCLRDRRSHPEGGCAYGSGAAGRAGPAGTISGVRWDDARDDSKGGDVTKDDAQIGTVGWGNDQPVALGVASVGC